MDKVYDGLKVRVITNNYGDVTIESKLGGIGFSLDTLGACCGVAELTNLYVSPRRGRTYKELASLFGTVVKDIIGSNATYNVSGLRVGRVIMTDVPSRNGDTIYRMGKDPSWSVVGNPTRNPKTGRNITMYTIEA